MMDIVDKQTIKDDIKDCEDLRGRNPQYRTSIIWIYVCIQDQFQNPPHYPDGLKISIIKGQVINKKYSHPFVTCIKIYTEP